MISDFIFDGRSLSEFGYVALFDGNSDTLNVSNMEYATIQGARSDVVQKAGYKYPENYSTTFSIIKNNCDSYEDEELTNDDISEITRWLVRKQYKWFRFVEDEVEPGDDIWFMARFDISKEMIGGRCMSLNLSMETNAPYGFTKKYMYKFTKSPFKLATHSDEEGYIYPDFEITILESGDLEITNYEEQRVTSLKNCVAGEVIHFYGENNQQIESTVDHDYVVEYNYKPPRLISQYSKYDNNFIVNLDCEIYCSFRGRRKVGLK